MKIQPFFQKFSSKGALTLTDSASMNVIFILWLIAIIVMITIISYLFLRWIRRGEGLNVLIAWYLITGGFTLGVSILTRLIIRNASDFFSVQSLSIIFLWPLIVGISPVGWYLRGSEGTVTPLESVDYWYFIVLIILPEVLSFLVVKSRQIYSGLKDRWMRSSDKV